MKTSVVLRGWVIASLETGVSSCPQPDEAELCAWCFTSSSSNSTLSSEVLASLEEDVVEEWLESIEVRLDDAVPINAEDAARMEEEERSENCSVEVVFCCRGMSKLLLARMGMEEMERYSPARKLLWRREALIAAVGMMGAASSKPAL